MGQTQSNFMEKIWASPFYRIFQPGRQTPRSWNHPVVIIEFLVLLRHIWKYPGMIHFTDITIFFI